MKQPHQERAHSKYSASSMERIAACPGSVKASAGLPDEDNEHSKRGTRAHEVVEAILEWMLTPDIPHTSVPQEILNKADGTEMFKHCWNSATYIIRKFHEHPGSEFQVETKVSLTFIHAELGGTFDSCILEHFGILYIIDFKYGTHLVSPIDNLQLITYGVGKAHELNWNFQTVRLVIIQPRARLSREPSYHDIPMEVLRDHWVPKIKNIIAKAEKPSPEFNEGDHCFFCKARKKHCPLKQEKKDANARSVFAPR